MFDVRRKLIESESVKIRQMLSTSDKSIGERNRPLELQNVSSADFSVFLVALHHR